MYEISFPHDKFFKEMFSRIEVVQDFCRHYFPPQIVSILDLSTLTYCKDSLIDHELSVQHSDLLLSVRIQSGEEIYLYLLFEHKSFPDPNVRKQLLQCMIKIWNQDNDSLFWTPILPLVVYHGEKGWTVSLQFQDLFPPIPELQDYLPRFQYLLIDLSKYPDEEIVGALSLQVTLLLLKYIFRGELKPKLREVFRLLAQVSETKDISEMLETVIIYLCAGTDQVDPEYVEQVRKETFDRRGETIMPSIAERWIEEGLEKGLEKGRQEGRQEGLAQGILMVLRHRFGDLSANVTNRVMAVEDKKALENLYQNAISAATLNDFLRNI